MATKHLLQPCMGKTIEETYQKRTQLQHILLRPDTYIGSIEKHIQTLWVYESESMVQRSVTYAPGLYKIFDEILVNAADNMQRDPKMDSLKVMIDTETNMISVYNNGDGVPVEVHQEEGVYVPELIFGHLLTSSNYDDNEKKTTGGRNGYGAKLTNIFSTEFVVETADGKRLKKYKQVFSKNMEKKSEPVITVCKESENWTKVSFTPDLAKFGMTHLEDDVVALMKKRVFDMAGCLGKTVKVELNGERVPVKSFVDYCDLYLQSSSKSRPEPLPRFMEKVNDRWEICVSLSEGQFQQVSFVNNIATIKGGTHVNYVTNQITHHILDIISTKNKNSYLGYHSVMNHLWIFVNALIDNPVFDSQTKETLIIQPSSFGSKCKLSQGLLNKVAKSGVVENLLSWADFKQNQDRKKRQRITGIPKLDDANEAGGRNSNKCTLILTEGDSAKNLAVAGIGVVGRDYYGVFPLRGKLLNVREASHKQILENAEIQKIKRILGLELGKVYDSVTSLRYGHLMIMTDQDHDGSHIKGLLINFIHSFWPSLLKIPSFLVEFITPIVKAITLSKENPNITSFYSIPEFEAWKESLGGSARNWTFKYYKGLGTSDSKEGKEYFQDLEKHKKDFVWVDEKDGEAIELAFSKKKIKARKNWLKQFEPGTYLNQKDKTIKYSDFVHKELILFSVADLQRSIPSMVDGLKPGQRKILFCAFKRNFRKEAKIAQFAGYVSEHSAYHHGETSLASTIIGMAQNYVGSNNINFFQPRGQFGSRNQGGKDHAHARYINTMLSDVTRYLFSKDDDILLDYLNEDGQSIEPLWYAPIIPTVLVNGSEGIGTGWSSYIPNYNPRDIIANVRHLLNDEKMVPMDPWYKGFKGITERSAAKEGGVTFTVHGSIQEINETTLRITELPLRKWTQDYKEFLESVMTGNGKANKFIQDFKAYNDDTTVHFEVFVLKENMVVAKEEGLHKKFKLTTSISTSNMHLFDPKGVIKKYDTPEQILEEFFKLRLGLYEKRKKFKLQNLEIDLLKLENKVRFVLGVVNKEINVMNRKRSELLIELLDKGFTPFPMKANGDEEVSGDGGENDYKYLMSMEIGSLTLEKIQQLCSDRDRLNGELDELKRATPKCLWMKDLDALEIVLDKDDKDDDDYEEIRLAQKTQRMGGGGSKVPKPASKSSMKKIKNPPSVDSIFASMEVGKSLQSVAIDSAPQVSKHKGGADIKKAEENASSPVIVLEDKVSDVDMVGELKDLRAAETMKAEVPAVPSTKNVSTKRAATKKKLPVMMEISDDAGYQKVRLTQKTQGMRQGGPTLHKAAPDSPRKNIKNPNHLDSVSAAIEIDSASSVSEPNGGAGSKKAQSKASTSPTTVLEDKVNDGDMAGDLKHKRATYNLESSPAMKNEVPVVSATKKIPNRIAAAKNPPIVKEILDDEPDLEIILNTGKKKVAKKPAANTNQAAKKRGQIVLRQRLKTEVVKPAETPGVSPEKKVRKMTESPFNKKSGSVPGKIRKGTDENSSPGSAETNGSATTITDEMSELALAPRARPQRLNRAKTTYYSNYIMWG